MLAYLNEGVNHQSFIKFLFLFWRVLTKAVLEFHRLIDGENSFKQEKGKRYPK